MRYALKFGYLGKNFFGYARQPNLRTVEKDIINALRKNKIIEDEKSANFQSASRTDKGVSAIGNVLALDTDYRKDGIIGALNAHLHDIWFYGISPVDDGFNARFAKQRWYRYYLLDSGFDQEKIRELAKIFIGTHKFSNFAKIEEGKKPERTIDSIDISKENDFIFLDFMGQTFLRNMIRRIVKALVDCAKQKISQEDILDALTGEVKFDFGMAAPEPLILMDVDYDFKFEIQKTKLRDLKKDLENNLHRLRIESFYYTQMQKSIEG
jgi:tRNA pseudouridine38-40 synthase